MEVRKSQEKKEVLIKRNKVKMEKKKRKKNENQELLQRDPRKKSLNLRNSKKVNGTLKLRI